MTQFKTLAFSLLLGAFCLSLLGANCQSDATCETSDDCPTGVRCVFDDPCDRWEIENGGDDDDSAEECPYTPSEQGYCRTDAWYNNNSE
jgi:hypothetical protein